MPFPAERALPKTIVLWLNVTLLAAWTTRSLPDADIFQPVCMDMLDISFSDEPGMMIFAVARVFMLTGFRCRNPLSAVGLVLPSLCADVCVEWYHQYRRYHHRRTRGYRLAARQLAQFAGFSQ